MRALAIMPVPMKPMLFDIVNVGLERTRGRGYGIVEVVVVRGDGCKIRY